MSEVGVTLNFTTDYSDEDIKILRDCDDAVTLKVWGYELDMSDNDLDTLIKALSYFRDKKDKSVLDTGLNIPDDKHVTFP